MAPQTKEERRIGLAELGERLSSIRVRSAQSLAAMRTSMSQRGQLTPIAVFRADSGVLEIVDGFKRLEAARALDLDALRVLTLALEPSQAKAAIITLNAGCRLSDIEEAWVVRSLYREDRLNQPAIGQLLDHDKSWVCRRLALAESLDESLQADVHLGIISTSAARELARLPRGNQHVVADVVLRRGLTAHQTAHLVQQLLAADAQEFMRLLEAFVPTPATPHPPQKTPAEQMIGEAAAIARIAGRLQARLLGAPLEVLGDAPAKLVRAALLELHPVVGALGESIHRVTRS